MKIERFQMDWHTKDNGVDYGLFLMRHMEDRSGEVEKLDADFLPECTSQKMQLSEMRKKYVCKMLLSDMNFCKASFVTTPEDYDNLSSYKRKKIYTESHLHEVEVRVKAIGVL
ncbi:unnamed protein product [Lactuca virosa]|uniref:Ubiquitin-like protease family profile domain-containing protein n=1 Tax=Lactuca virosa TaxID=75947 RepID=A0AAU9M4X8_9ASTR|nr:unnamed protein product [Lactuca virosa]